MNIGFIIYYVLIDSANNEQKCKIKKTKCVYVVIQCICAYLIFYKKLKKIHDITLL